MSPKTLSVTIINKKEVKGVKLLELLLFIKNIRTIIKIIIISNLIKIRIFFFLKLINVTIIKKIKIVKRMFEYIQSFNFLTSRVNVLSKLSFDLIESLIYTFFFIRQRIILTSTSPMVR